MSVLDSVLSVLSGGFTGILGTAVSAVATYQSKKLDIELEKQKSADEIAMRKLDIEAQAAEIAAQAQIAQIQTQGEVDKADDEALAKSYELEPQQYSEKTLLTHTQNWLFVLVDTFKALIRPSLTVYLCAIVTIIYMQTRGLINTNQGDSFALLEKLINTILYVTTTVILWWFGSRANKNSK